ncbi:hypothetical protein IWX65_002108 [Arthrobacter sp. CAN_A214]|uniref:hypothetical protein n=1 Tax=Arthrobacter sp. CAN_A214 TaxID=2787720 RepID=UPI0018CB950C
MSLTISTSTRIDDLRALRRGDTVEARRKDEVHYRGRVEETAPGLGVVWIRDSTAGHRAILHLDEYSIWRVAV